MRSYQVNPLAEYWPMLPRDELQELAEDVKLHGLITPITLDSEGRILEGRNRLAACELAGVEPKFASYEGDDELGYVLSMNDRRRHMSKGQRAMVVARMLSLQNSDTTSRQMAESAGMSQTRIAQALTVLRHAPDLADEVVAGARSLDDAVKVARERKLEADGNEARLARLQESAPDLATQVEEGKLSLGEASAAARERAEEAERHVRQKTEALTRDYHLLPTSGNLQGLADYYTDGVDLGKSDVERLEFLCLFFGKVIDKFKEGR